MSHKNGVNSIWVGLGISAVSGVLISLSMPNYDINILGWIGLVPLFMFILSSPEKFTFFLAWPCGLIWAFMAHNWYLKMFGTLLGVLQIFGVGSYYAGLIALGFFLQKRLPKNLKLIALPVVWSALEFAKFITPFIDNWWFALLAKSQWRFPPALQILSFTGFPGLSFLLILTNIALAVLFLKAFQNRSIDRHSAVAIIVAAIIVGLGALSIPLSSDKSFPIVTTADMTDLDKDILALGKLSSKTGKVSPFADTPEQSQAIFDINAALTRSAAHTKPAFVVWPENEFADADDPIIISQLGELAKQINAYIVADVVWRAPTGMHDTALMVGPEGKEIGRRAKINVTDGEKAQGVVPGPHDFPIFDTPYGKVGIGVCWDRHRVWITRELARAGAQIILMPIDDDFNGSLEFPAYHASDSVFRAVENRVAVGLGSVSGISLVVDPYGRITAESELYKRMTISGNVFTTPDRTMFTRFGDWFGWLMVASFIFLGSIAIFHKKNY